MDSELVNCEIVKNVLTWWWSKRADFDYPWRSESDPYRWVVAEILLIRTRRDVVVRVYRELLQRWPTACELANANPKEVELVIKPLGLVKRVRLLIEASKALCNGKQPWEVAGVGEYSRRLLMLRAGKREAPALDSNAKRIYERITGRRLAERAENSETLLRFFGDCAHDPLEISYAVMDFGYAVCKPRNPNCNTCPIRSKCKYYESVK